MPWYFLHYYQQFPPGHKSCLQEYWNRVTRHVVDLDLDLDLDLEPDLDLDQELDLVLVLMMEHSHKDPGHKGRSPPQCKTNQRRLNGLVDKCKPDCQQVILSEQHMTTTSHPRTPLSHHH